MPTYLFVLPRDTPDKKQATIDLDYGRRKGALHQVGDGVDDFEGGGSLDDSNCTSDNIVGRDHSIIDV